MKTKYVLVIAGAVGVLGTSGLAMAQTPSIQFEPQPCVVTLAPNYAANAAGGLSAEIPTSAIACGDGHQFDVATDSITGGVLTNADGAEGLTLAENEVYYFDAAVNAVMTKTVLQVNGYGGTSSSPVTFDRFATGYGNLIAGPYITAGSRYYRVVLAAPVTVTRQAGPVPECTVMIPAGITWRWNQAPYWVLPDSAIQCTGGVTFSSASMNANISLNSRLENAGLIFTVTRPMYDPSTGQYVSKRELRLFNTLGRAGGQNIAGIISGTAASGTPTWGRFTLGTTDSQPTVNPTNFVAPRTDAVSPYYRVTLAAPFTIKRTTDVTLKATRRTGGKLRLSITADRNASFQNTTAPTYRRQTVLPATPADHAVLRRGNRVLKKVKLSNYGTASVTIKDAPGRNVYSVTMVATNDNYQGRATIIR